MATEFGFSAITGVAFAPTLARIARRNAAVLVKAYPHRTRTRTRTRINIVIGDAVEYRLPDDPIVVFLYNPCGQLLRNIDESLRAHARPVRRTHGLNRSPPERGRAGGAGLTRQRRSLFRLAAC